MLVSAAADLKEKTVDARMIVATGAVSAITLVG